MRRSLVAALLALTLLTVPAEAQAPVPLDTSTYAGYWSNKHFQLRVTHDGHAIAEYALAVWCAPGGPTPCDSVSDAGRIEWGGLAALTFTEAQPGMLTGRVDWSTTTDGILKTGEPIRLSVRSDGTAQLGSDDGRVPITLCSNTATAGLCGQ